MRLITLVENTTERTDCIAEHGLCIYAETQKHKLLLDSGQSDALLHNARTAGVDLTQVDILILSHGHYDHAGGILPFAGVNPRARILMQKEAVLPHYHGERYIGIDPKIPELPQVELVEGDCRLDEELFLFAGITGRRLYPEGNHRLSMVRNGQKTEDDFRHEQCLVITQGEKSILLSGCAHNGILNILDRYRELFGKAPDYVVTGFHMMKKHEEYTPEEIRTIRETAGELCKTDTLYYSGHCTGRRAFEMMKEIMGDQLQALHSGEMLKGLEL